MTVPPKLGCHLNAPITAFWATAGPAPYSRGNIWTRSVVHVGTSHPEKSVCSVQIGFCSANADARTAQSIPPVQPFPRFRLELPVDFASSQFD